MGLLIMLPVPAMVQSGGNLPAWPGLEGFIASKIHSESEPNLVEALRTLHRYSPGFRATLEAFWREQHMTLLYLRKTSGPTSGNISIQKSNKGYVMHLFVQEAPTLRGLDRIEPWVASVVFLALEVSRRGGVTEIYPQQFEFSNELVRDMWDDQAKLRKELRKAGKEARSGLAWDGERLFLREVLAHK